MQCIPKKALALSVYLSLSLSLVQPLQATSWQSRAMSIDAKQAGLYGLVAAAIGYAGYRIYRWWCTDDQALFRQTRSAIDQAQTCLGCMHGYVYGMEPVQVELDQFSLTDAELEACADNIRLSCYNSTEKLAAVIGQTNVQLDASAAKLRARLAKLKGIETIDAKTVADNINGLLANIAVCHKALSNRLAVLQYHMTFLQAHEVQRDLELQYEYELKLNDLTAQQLAPIVYDKQREGYRFIGYEKQLKKDIVRLLQAIKSIEPIHSNKEQTLERLHWILRCIQEAILRSKVYQSEIEEQQKFPLELATLKIELAKLEKEKK